MSFFFHRVVEREAADERLAFFAVSKIAAVFIPDFGKMQFVQVTAYLSVIIDRRIAQKLVRSRQ
jgi:hypothetical protein